MIQKTITLETETDETIVEKYDKKLNTREKKIKIQLMKDKLKDFDENINYNNLLELNIIKCPNYNCIYFLYMLSENDNDLLEYNTENNEWKNITDDVCLDDILESNEWKIKDKNNNNNDNDNESNSGCIIS